MNAICALQRPPVVPSQVQLPTSPAHAAVTPRLGSWQLTVPVRQVNGVVGTSLDAATIAKLLSKMQLSATASQDGQEVHCKVPVTRSDVLHACDVAEVSLRWLVVCTGVLWAAQHKPGEQHAAALEIGTALHVIVACNCDGVLQHLEVTCLKASKPSAVPELMGVNGAL